MEEFNSEEMGYLISIQIPKESEKFGLYCPRNGSAAKILFSIPQKLENGRKCFMTAVRQWIIQGSGWRFDYAITHILFCILFCIAVRFCRVTKHRRSGNVAHHL